MNPDTAETTHKQWERFGQALGSASVYSKRNLQTSNTHGGARSPDPSHLFIAYKIFFFSKQLIKDGSSMIRFVKQMPLWVECVWGHNYLFNIAFCNMLFWHWFFLKVVFAISDQVEMTHFTTVFGGCCFSHPSQLLHLIHLLYSLAHLSKIEKWLFTIGVSWGTLFFLCLQHGS